MNKPKIVAYLKTSCGWSQGVRAIMRKYDLPFEDRDIINDPAQRQEMIEKSGQMLSPCVEIDGKMLPDISGEEVEAYLLANRLVGTTEKEADARAEHLAALLNHFLALQRVVDDVAVFEGQVVLAHDGAHALAPAAARFQVSNNFWFVHNFKSRD